MDTDFISWRSSQLKSFLKSTNWRQASDATGKQYYYDKNTNHTQWEIPKEVAAYEETLTLDVYSKGTIEKSPAVSGTETTFEELMGSVDRKDAILEPGIAQTVEVLIAKQVSQEEISAKLASNYVGYPQLSRVMLEWIKLAKVLETHDKVQSSQSTKSPYGLSSSRPSSNYELPKVQEMGYSAAVASANMAHFASDRYGEELLVPLCAEELARLFNKKLVDEYFAQWQQGQAQNNAAGADQPVLPPAVLALMRDPTYSATMHELYKTHPHSTFLHACCTAAIDMSADNDSSDNRNSSTHNGSTAKSENSHKGDKGCSSAVYYFDDQDNEFFTPKDTKQMVVGDCIALHSALLLINSFMEVSYFCAYFTFLLLIYNRMVSVLDPN
jgi:hypothetical protein